jgi:hypothetical protein
MSESSRALMHCFKASHGYSLNFGLWSLADVTTIRVMNQTTTLTEAFD